MAKLLKKHFGLGGKKGPPHPPKPDYVTQKSSSVQELLSRSPTSEHKSSASLSSAASHIGSFEVAQLADSPSRVSRLSQSSLASTLGFGARPKEPKESSNAPSPKDKHSSVSGCDDDIQDSPVEEPTLLDEYSDPFDLKKQIQDTPELLGACAPATAQAVAEDDYSVPYEVKKMMKEKKLRDSEKGKSPGEDGKGSPHGSPSKSNNIHAEDQRPREEYDEPWEWSNTHSMIFDHMVNNDTVSGTGAQTRTPLMTKRTTADTNERPPSLGAGAGAELETVAVTVKEGGNKKETTPNAETTPSPDVEEVIDELPPPPPPEEEADVVEVVEEPEIEYENMKDDYSKPVPEKPPDMNDEEYERYTQLREEYERTQNRQCPEHDKRINDKGNYEEPWDLSSTQRDLEDRIKAHVSAAGTSGGTVTVANDDASATQAIPQLELNDDGGGGKDGGGDGGGAEASGSSPSGPPVAPASDGRPQEGYEKPWDWKPHKKDERGQEGYEKPWDWKPHQKDDRPGEEYEQPWDNKVQSIEENLMKAKGGAGKDNLIEKLDNRPTDEYEEPWDQKMKAMLNRTGSDAAAAAAAAAGPSTSGTGPSAGPSAGPSQQQRKLNLDLSASGWGAKAERIDPMLPLDKQGWYHGAISRVDAEGFLRVHKEGSYLVRMSESNKMDFSLSLKSARGFMHMKIVNRDHSFILGQFSQPFDTIPLMIHHYSVNKLPIKGAEHMSLLHPVMHEWL